MSWRLPVNEHNLPKIAASAVLPYRPVKSDTTVDQVLPAATSTDRVIGVTGASAGPGDPVNIYTQGVVWCIAGVSVGVGAEVAAASSNGALGLVTAASGRDNIALGETQDAALAGERVAVLLTFRSVQTGGG